MKVDGSAVIGIDEVAIPKFRSLIKIGDSGAGDFQQCLAETVDHAGMSHLLQKISDVYTKMENRPYEKEYFG